MKNSRLSLLAMAITVCVAAATSRAALLSDYPFDTDATNLVDGATSGTLVNGAQIVPGKIGTGAVILDGVSQYVDITANGYPNSVAGMKIGSATFWMKSSVTNSGLYPVIGSSQPGFQIFEINLLGTKMSMLNRAHEPPGSYGPASNKGVFNDGAWHQVTWTWNVTPAGEAGVGGTSAVYLDGVLNATPNPSGTGWIGSNTIAPWNSPLRIGSAERAYYFAGSLDDVAIWSTSLTAAQARAVYNLGNDATLNYNARDIDTLFTVFAAGPGGKGATGDGKMWQYATGLTGNAGDVVNNHAAVILDGSGNGVAIVSSTRQVERKTP